MGSIKLANCKSRNKDYKTIPSVLHKGNFKKKEKEKQEQGCHEHIEQVSSFAYPYAIFNGPPASTPLAFAEASPPHAQPLNSMLPQTYPPLVFHLQTCSETSHCSQPDCLSSL